MIFYRDKAGLPRFDLTMGHMKSPSIFRAALVAGFAAVCVPSIAHAQNLPRIGADIGYSYLLDSKARSVFGSGVTDIGLGFGNVNPSVDGKVGLDVSILRPKQTDNGIKSDALVISAGPEYRKLLLSGSNRSGAKSQVKLPRSTFPSSTNFSNIGDLPSTLPYYGASVNLVYAQVNAPTAGVDGNGFGVGGSVFAGVAFNNRFYLEGRVRANSAVEGFNFSRAGVTAGIRF